MPGFVGLSDFSDISKTGNIGRDQLTQYDLALYIGLLSYTCQIYNIYLIFYIVESIIDHILNGKWPKISGK